ncbi:unnamed protein product [Bursaphelenchus okinawaensis]|uniref:Sodium/potassium-transporting ATPase subunit beta-1-interacting protein n=1 Tax=Bursaphelenchus okinawaensis TaxID=465554 RepID=A0A811K9D4_9BILA|nr:unnamed protein product [Bursaphelenchus okinawaensis]CAG9094866.1 unnamed protein product [Bursaphelenchus okinawaensis]
MCSSATKVWLSTTLIVWLILSVIREVFDLIGRLWIPVTFNLFQILACISGLFSISSRRITLLLLLTISCIASAGYNVFLILWYNDVIKGYPRLLSAGLPFGQSFFVKHTPGCETFFNLTTSQWNQKACGVPYYNAESFQAVVHILLAIMTFVFSIVLMIERKISQGQGDKQQNLKLDSKEIGYSYMNSQYDSPKQATDKKESLEKEKRDSINFEKQVSKFHDEYAKVDMSRKSKTKSEYLSPENLSGEHISIPTNTAVAERLANHSGEREIKKMPKPLSNGNLTALISFDPKSKDILKVSEHHNDSEDEEEYEPQRSTRRRNDSETSTPSVQAPMPSLIRPDRDSGHPSSSASDWTTEFSVSSPPPLMKFSLDEQTNLVSDYSKDPANYSYYSPQLNLKYNKKFDDIPRDHHYRRTNIEKKTTVIPESPKILPLKLNVIRSSKYDDEADSSIEYPEVTSFPVRPRRQLVDACFATQLPLHKAPVNARSFSDELPPPLTLDSKKFRAPDVDGLLV